MIVALIALFVALAGVGWAATQLPPGSVGTKQLRDGAVTGRKLASRAVGNRNLAPRSVGRTNIRRGAVGLFQIDSRAVQSRITGACPPATAISSVTPTGGVGCNSTLPQEIGAEPGALVTLTPGAASTVTAVRLAGTSPFLLFADPQVTINGSAGEGVRVDCTLSATTTRTSRTHNLRVEVGQGAQPLAGAIPLVLAAPAGSGATATVSCTDSFSPPTDAAPGVTVQSAVNAIQIQSAS
jgi:hypothetical protein